MSDAADMVVKETAEKLLALIPREPEEATPHRREVGGSVAGCGAGSPT